MSERSYGYRPRAELPDPQDRLFAAYHAAAPKPHEFVDHMDLIQRWRNQGPIGRCVGTGVCGMVENNRVKAGHPDEQLSPDHVYAESRLQHLGKGERLSDTGTYIRTALKAVTKTGVALERDWPMTTLHVNERPPIAVELKGLHKAEGVYQFIEGQGEAFRDACCHAVDLYGEIVIGHQLGRSYENHVGQGVLMPPSANERPVGGHCTRINSYRNGGRELLVGGSWKNWGFSYRTKAGVLIESLGWISHEWFYHPWFMEAAVFIPPQKKAA